MTRDEIREAVARGWTHPTTEKLVMDVELAEAIVEEVWKADKTANLGYASTQELVYELYARTNVAANTGEIWPTYKTINS